jgi:GT2 family glycosyltransferase
MEGLSIIIPTKDRGMIFYKTLESVVAASAHINPEIIVVNNSINKVLLPHKPENAKVYDNPFDKNSVFSSRNYGASIAKSPILLFIDDDILVTKESIDYAIAFYKVNSNACFNVNWQYPPDLINKIKNTVFGRYLIKHGFSTMKSMYNGLEWRDDEPFISKHIASFFFCIKKDVFAKIGGYNEKHLHEGTDIDISNSLNKNNVVIWINPLIMVYHNEEDRVHIMNWLERKKRVGAIHRNSVNMGDTDHILNYTATKRIAFNIIYQLQPVFLSIIKLYDAVGLKSAGTLLINAMLGANMCQGYYSIKK